MKPTIKSARLATGVTLPYVEQGDSSGLPVVLLHGLSDSWRSFERVLPCLPAHVHAFAVTQRGHGDADRPADGYRPSDLADDLEAFLDAVGVDAALLVGHSMGSFAAQRFAVDHPERVLGLVLLGSCATLRECAPAIELTNAVKEISDPVDPEFIREFQRSTLARPVPDGFFETVVDESLKLPARVWQASCSGMIEDDSLDDLTKITAPTLLMWGDQDQFFPMNDQKVILSRVPRSELLVYAGGGHGFHWEDPAAVAADLVAFAERIRAERSAPRAIA